MTANAWLIVVVLGVLVLWVVAGVIDDLAARRPLPRVGQSAPAVPLLPPARRPDLGPPDRQFPDLPRARAVRRGRAFKRRSGGCQ